MMKKNLFEYLKQQKGFSFPESKPDFSEEKLENELGYVLPEDYKDIMRNCYCCELMGENDSLIIFGMSEVYNFLYDDFLMVPLKGLLLFGGDNGGNWYAYDPKNRLGRGEFAVYFIDRDYLNFNRARYLGSNLSETFLKVLESKHAFCELDSMEEEGFPQIENDAVPRASVGSLAELLSVIPKQIDSEKQGKGVFEIKEESGLITGHYKMEDEMCFCHTWSRTYQGFYDAIAPALKMHGII